MFGTSSYVPLVVFSISLCSFSCLAQFEGEDSSVSAKCWSFELSLFLRGLFRCFSSLACLTVSGPALVRKSEAGSRVFTSACTPGARYCVFGESSISIMQLRQRSVPFPFEKLSALHAAESKDVVLDQQLLFLFDGETHDT